MLLAVHPTDDRNLPPLNRIGDPDDILASVRVQGGKVRLAYCHARFFSFLVDPPVHRGTDSRRDLPGDALVPRLHSPRHHSAH